ncbi:BnaA09g14670D [Brassica napus]|uniref:BnaA09g14670D protein n=1 Tax=Brassica napus TaxID=3708 RepID=A0A078IFP9_BRANA|nr:BnaA09g14670D [Brassica napus]
MFFRYVCMEAAGNFREAPRAGHFIVALERNYFYVRVVAMAEGCLLDPQRLVLFSLLVKNLDSLDDIYYYAQLTDGGYDAQFDQTPGKLGCIDLVVFGLIRLWRWQFSPIEVEGTEKRHVMLDAKCDHREKTKKTLSKDSAGCSQQADTIDDAKKKVADTNDVYTNTVATADANINIARSHELYGMMMFLTIIHTEYSAFVFIL